MCPKLLPSSLTLQPYGLQPVRLLCPWHSPGKNTGMGCRALLQGIFPTQGSNPHLLNLPALAREFFITSTTWEAGSKNENHKDIPEKGMKNPSRSVFSKLLLFSRSAVYDSLRPHGLQHARLPCPSPSPRACSNSRPSSQWCHPAISSSVVSFSSCPQSFPESGSFQMSQLFKSGGQSIGASASVLPMNIQDFL